MFQCNMVMLFVQLKIEEMERVKKRSFHWNFVGLRELNLHKSVIFQGITLNVYDSGTRLP